jgi:hypothetical protein
LQGVLSAANVYDTSFIESSLHGTTFCGAYLYQARFDGADAIAAKFVGAAARYASFRGAVLESADFRDADLTRADFTGACLLGADFTAAKLGGAVFNGARLGLDPNRKTTTFGHQTDRRIAAIGDRVDKLRFVLQQKGWQIPSRGFPLPAPVAYDVSTNGDRLLQRRIKIGGFGELPPSCPLLPDGTVPAPEPNFGEE